MEVDASHLMLKIFTVFLRASPVEKNPPFPTNICWDQKQMFISISKASEVTLHGFLIFELDSLKFLQSLVCMDVRRNGYQTQKLVWRLSLRKYWGRSLSILS